MKKIGILTAAMLMVLGLTACGAKTEEGGQESAAYKNDVETVALRDAVAETLGDNYWPEESVPGEYLESMFGLDPETYEEVICELPLMSTHVDTLLIVKAKEDSLETVQEAVLAYQKNQVENSMQYPMNLGKVQASMVETYGNYVCFVLLGGDITAVEADGDEAIIEFCQEENEKALGAIETALK